ncbi:MAG: DUF6232 family protein [Desulfatiglandales bacterium]
MGDEKVYYKDERGVIVTDTRFIVGATTYPLQGITSFKNTHIPANKSPAIFLILIGLILTIVGKAENSGMWLLGLLLLLAGGLYFLTKKDKYILRVTTASGEKRTLSSLGNSDRITKIADALDQAIVERG